MALTAEMLEKAYRENHDSGPFLPEIPGYDVHEVLGRGGMGVVYEAQHLELDRLVALSDCSPECPAIWQRSA